jgi:hypothetical protein
MQLTDKLQHKGNEMDYRPTVYIEPTLTSVESEFGNREVVPGRVDLTLSYPAPGAKDGYRTFTFEGRSGKSARRMAFLLAKCTARGAWAGNELAADMMRQ